jgi:hypothetical protein
MPAYNAPRVTNLEDNEVMHSFLTLPMHVWCSEQCLFLILVTSAESFLLGQLTNPYVRQATG